MNIDCIESRKNCFIVAIIKHWLFGLQNTMRKGKEVFLEEENLRDDILIVRKEYLTSFNINIKFRFINLFLKIHQDIYCLHVGVLFEKPIFLVENGVNGCFYISFIMVGGIYQQNLN